MNVLFVFIMCVLIVDDEFSICKIIGLVVESMGYEVVFVFNGVCVLKVLEEDMCDVCFFDVNFGMDDGFVVLEKF